MFYFFGGLCCIFYKIRVNECENSKKSYNKKILINNIVINILRFFILFFIYLSRFVII